jgi:hypothetical protein
VEQERDSLLFVPSVDRASEISLFYKVRGNKMTPGEVSETIMHSRLIRSTRIIYFSGEYPTLTLGITLAETCVQCDR